MLRRPTVTHRPPVRLDLLRTRVLARTVARAFALAVVGWVGFGALAGLAPGRAWAMKNGIEASGCEGCHGGGKVPTVTLTGAPAGAAVGQPITLTVTISPTNGPCGGFYLTTDGASSGAFKATDSGTVAMADGITHSTPRVVTGGGPVIFTAQWTASQPTGVQFDVYALSCNNDGRPSGDGGGMATLAMVSGCTGMSYYLDQDGDGYGTSDPSYPVRMDCSKPVGYSAVSGDCNDFNADIHPGAAELCDGKDNNCNGQIDENIVPQKYCEDKDGDGHGVPTGMTKMDCAPSPGFGDCNGDCNDMNAAVYPGATEICDGIDNNCNGQVDEGVRMTCGLGWCRRYAEGCGSSICTPGMPMVETCNFFDDDCDGVIDNGTDEQLCGASGLSCVAGRCVAAGSMSTLDGGSGTGSSGGAAVTPTGSGGAPATAGAGTGGHTAGGVGVLHGTGGGEASPPGGTGLGSTGSAPPAETSAGSGGCALIPGAPPSEEMWFLAAGAMALLACHVRRRRMGR
jgi:hypothetical protein